MATRPHAAKFQKPSLVQCVKLCAASAVASCARLIFGYAASPKWERFRSFCVYRSKRKMSAWRNPSQGAQWNSGGRLVSFRSDMMKMLARSVLFVLAHAAFVGGAMAVTLLNSATLTAALP